MAKHRRADNVWSRIHLRRLSVLTNKCSRRSTSSHTVPRPQSRILGLRARPLPCRDRKRKGHVSRAPSLFSRRAPSGVHARLIMSWVLRSAPGGARTPKGLGSRGVANESARGSGSSWRRRRVGRSTWRMSTVSTKITMKSPPRTEPVTPTKI